RAAVALTRVAHGQRLPWRPLTHRCSVPSGRAAAAAATATRADLPRTRVSAFNRSSARRTAPVRPSSATALRLRPRPTGETGAAGAVRVRAVVPNARQERPVRRASVIVAAGLVVPAVAEPAGRAAAAAPVLVPARATVPRAHRASLAPLVA